jgi:HNH endonuclease
MSTVPRRGDEPLFDFVNTLLGVVRDIPREFCQCGCGTIAPLAPHSHAAKGLVKGQPLSFCWGHNRHVVRPLEVEGTCWLWKAGRAANGYGHSSTLPGVLVHRAVYAAVFGPVPDGYLVCHTCDVRNCANPHHLFAGSAQDNVDDMHAKGRWRPGDRRAGEDHWARKVKAPMREQIRLLLEGGASHREIARQLGVGRTTVGTYAKENPDILRCRGVQGFPSPRESNGNWK